MTKADVITLLNCMPDEFILDEFIGKLIVSEKIRQAIKCVEEGRIVSHSDAKRIAQSWKPNPNS